MFLGPSGKAYTNVLDYKCINCSSDVSGSHITALCPKLKKSSSNAGDNTATNLCLCSKNQEKSLLLPTLTITFFKGKNSRPVRCLLDCGSMRSYVSSQVVKDLCETSDISHLSEIEYDIKTFIGTEKRKFHQLSLGVKVLNHHAFFYACVS